LRPAARDPNFCLQRFALKIFFTVHAFSTVCVPLNEHGRKYTLQDPANVQHHWREAFAKTKVCTAARRRISSIPPANSEESDAIYLERGREDGYDFDDWLAAEEELQFELSPRLFTRAAALLPVASSAVISEGMT